MARSKSRQLAAQLHRQIVAELHLGRLRPGDGLRSIRQLASEVGVSERCAARAYQLLEGEGLIRIHDRSGVRVATPDHLAGEPPGGQAQWLSQTLVEAWERGVGVPAYAALVRRFSSGTPARCLCIESSDDQTYALCAELSRDFGFATEPARVDRLVSADQSATAQCRDRLRWADLLVTTSFHASWLGPLAEQAGRDLIVVRLHDVAAQSLRTVLAQDGLVLIVADARFGERIRAMWPNTAERMLVVPLDQLGKTPLPAGRPVLMTGAAAAQARDRKYPELHPSGPLICPDSARQLIDWLIRFQSALPPQ